MTWLMAWLSVAQHPRDEEGKLLGPLLGNLTARGRNVASRDNQTILQATHLERVKVGGSSSPDASVWFTASGERVNLTENGVRTVLNELRDVAIEYAQKRVCSNLECECEHCPELREAIERLKEATAHSWRVMYAVWAARMGGERGYVQAKLGGRWELLSLVFDVYWGRGESKRNRYRGERDPLLDKIPWPIQGMTFRSTSSSFFEMRQMGKCSTLPLILLPILTLLFVNVKELCALLVCPFFWGNQWHLIA